MEKTKETGIKEIVFGAEHVGTEVYDIRFGNGTIRSFDNDSYPYHVKVLFSDCNYRSYTNLGYNLETDKNRTLFVGHNVKITVEEDDLPEKMICPVCGVDHELMPEFTFGGDKYYSFNNIDDNCPFINSIFDSKVDAAGAMRNLIKAMS